MTPGTYIRLRREARGLSLLDVALRTETDPAVSARTRAEYLQAIEADAQPLTIDAAIALWKPIGFDMDVLIALCAVHHGHALAAPPVCRVCACSDHDACVGRGRPACHWSEDDLCSACASAAAAAQSAAA